MKEFIFGPLGTEEARIDRLRDRYRGVRHRYQMDPIAPGAGESPILTVTAGLDLDISHVVCHLIEPTLDNLVFHHIGTEWDHLNWDYYQVWQVVLPSRPDGTVVRYRILAYPVGDGEPILADEGETFSYLVGDPNPPKWAAGAIIYQVFPDRFNPGNGRPWKQPGSLNGIYGGTLAGITEKLDYIAGLGFNCIWLNPFFPDAKTHHGYHATDYFGVNPRLGTEDDMHALVDSAHARGIRLLLDFVANHWGSDHPSFQSARSDRTSPYYDWYRWKAWPDDYETFFQVKELPKVNLDHPPARQYMLDAAQYWLGEFDFDGFRLDYALGPSLDFWTDFGVATRSVKPDVWLFGEAVDTPERQLRYWGRLHGCLDFMLQDRLRQTFAFDQLSLAAFDAFLTSHEAYFPPSFSRPSFLDNHDVNRFLWLVKGDKRKLKLAALCQFTLAGPPIVYYGTEVGLSQQDDIIMADGRHVMAQARQPMVWGDRQDADLREYYRRLIQLRRSHPVLWHGKRQTVHLDPSMGTYAYLRIGTNETITVAFNLSDSAQRISANGHEFELPAWGGDFRVDPAGE